VEVSAQENASHAKTVTSAVALPAANLPLSPTTEANQSVGVGPHAGESNPKPWMVNRPIGCRRLTSTSPKSASWLQVTVPLIVASPFSRPGYVSHEVYDLTSVLRFVETRFNLPALTARDANATPITDLFDFTQPHLLEPPALPDAVIDPTQDALCQQLMSQQ